MPKIKSITISVCSKKISYPRFHDKQHFKVNIFYSEGVFYSPLEEEIGKKYINLDEADLKKRGIGTTKVKSDFILSINADSEAKLVEKLNLFYSEEIDLDTSSRPVILIHYESSACQYGDHFYNEEHPQTNIRLGLTYATEHRIGKSLSYSSEARGYRKQKFRIWDNAEITVIDDTPENRKWLDSLYLSIRNVEEALDTLTRDKDKLLQVIKSGVKLLENPKNDG